MHAWKLLTCNAIYLSKPPRAQGDAASSKRKVQLPDKRRKRSFSPVDRVCVEWKAAASRTVSEL